MYDPNHRTPVRVKIEGRGLGMYVDIATKATDQILDEFSNISACRNQAGIVSAGVRKTRQSSGFLFCFSTFDMVQRDLSVPLKIEYGASLRINGNQGSVSVIGDSSNWWGLWPTGELSIKLGWDLAPAPWGHAGRWVSRSSGVSREVGNSNVNVRPTAFYRLAQIILTKRRVNKTHLQAEFSLWVTSL